jgi:hypothetical protein
MKFLSDRLEVAPGRVGVGRRSNFSPLRIVEETEEVVQEGCKHQWVLSFGSEFMAYVCERCYEVKPVKQEPLKIYSAFLGAKTKERMGRGKSRRG